MRANTASPRCATAASSRAKLASMEPVLRSRVMPEGAPTGAIMTAGLTAD
jgi:hypothetical protein